jgi:uncharacterized protein
MSETPTTPNAVYSARPTVRINTQEYAQVRELLVSMELTEQAGGLSALELRFTNIASDTQGGADFAFEDDRILKLGAVIAVYSGDETLPQEIFQGIITGLELEFSGGAPELVVLAEDALQKARMSRQTQVYSEVTIAKLGQQLAEQVGLTPVITGFSQNIGTQVQLDESDLAFLRRLLHRYDGDLQVVGKELHVIPRSQAQRGTMELRLNSQLRRVRMLADLANQVTEVTVAGWDVRQGSRVLGRSQGAHPGPGRGSTGAQLLERSIGKRAHHLAHLTATTEEEAQAIADTAFDAYARRLVCVSGVAEGNPALRVGTHVTLRGLGDRFDNTYYINQTCHRFDLTQGYETEFEAESAFWGGGT